MCQYQKVTDRCIHCNRTLRETRKLKRLCFAPTMCWIMVIAYSRINYVDCGCEDTQQQQPERNGLGAMEEEVAKVPPHETLSTQEIELWKCRSNQRVQQALAFLMGR
ncbi:a27a2cca-5a33-4f2b-9b16-76243d674f83 [Thermothielavioides terrestris]|uniref:A27a2cca-5a33-4f2b-9b16-76243d674f83 n=1 Tax=Thermothielavioides terrestris TaxID=2587410 RepID=A0A3S4F3B9_9PEZI|nr:a27a2cca-5a33-4f2b-9b16-76243d674f83 [Thermothielavioides terrestris]